MDGTRAASDGIGTLLDVEVRRVPRSLSHPARQNRGVNRKEFGQAFAALVDQGSRRLHEELTRYQRPLTVRMPPEELFVRTESGSTTWQLTSRRQTRNTVAVQQFWLQSLLRDDRWRTMSLEAAQLLASEPFVLPPPNWMIRAGGQQVIWDTWQLANEEPMSQLLAEFIVAPAWWCLRQLPSVEISGARLIARVADEIVEVLTAGRFRVRYSVAVTCSLSGSHDLGTVAIRPFSDEERGLRMVAQRNSTWINSVMPPSHVLEVTAFDMDGERRQTKPLLDAILALELLGVRIGGDGLAEMRTVPEWAETGVTRTSLPMARFVPPEPGLDVDLTGLQGLIDSLSGLNVDFPESRQEQALHRYRLSCSRDSDTDALLDLAIALEALLLPGWRSNSFRMAVNGAHWVGMSADDRGRIHDDLGHLSSVRNAHGEGKVPGSKVHRARMDGHAIATVGLRRAVETTFPDAEWFGQALFKSD
jgi:hypothetical protein